jgi:hypothetical protein
MREALGSSSRAKKIKDSFIITVDLGSFISFRCFNKNNPIEPIDTKL